jgi:hypothetical protein
MSFVVLLKSRSFRIRPQQKEPSMMTPLIPIIPFLLHSAVIELLYEYTYISCLTVCIQLFWLALGTWPVCHFYCHCLLLLVLFWRSRRKMTTTQTDDNNDLLLMPSLMDHTLPVIRAVNGGENDPLPLLSVMDYKQDATSAKTVRPLESQMMTREYQTLIDNIDPIVFNDRQVIRSALILETIRTITRNTIREKQPRDQRGVTTRCVYR